MDTMFPFANMDVSKMMANFKVPSFEYEALVELQKRNLATFQEAGTIMTKGMQLLVERQVEMTQKGIEAAIENVRELTKATTPEAGAKCQMAFARTAFETQVANLRELGELAQKTGGEAFEVVNKRVAEGLDEVVTATNGAIAKAAPKAKATK